MKVAIGCDHIVLDIKEHVKDYLKNKGYEIIDCGTYDQKRTHYPIYGRKVGLLVASKDVDCGIVLCGTGIGISNAAQKVKGVRCALVSDPILAKLAKEEYDCNVIAFGGRVLGIGRIEEILDAYFESEYHPSSQNQTWIKKIDGLLNEVSQDDHFFDEFIEKWNRGDYHD
ncbi:MAG: galactose-6-phosphate isomerase subunit LacB [Traorella sp.]